MHVDPQTKLLDGQALAATIRGEVRDSVAACLDRGQRPPGLAVILAGNNPASQVYVRSKTRDCAEVGMLGQTIELPETVSEDELLAEIDRLNADDSVDGILVQLPLPGGLDEARVQERVLPQKDVDGFHAQNVGNLWLGRDGFVSCTPAGIIELLERYGIEMAGQHAVVVGRSNIVGKPMAALLLREHCTVTVCHSRTRDLAAICRQADILIAAVGRTGLIQADWVKEGAVVVDVGMNRITEREQLDHFFPNDAKRQRSFEKRGSVLTGDVDFTRVRPRSSAITPVPGGVGPLTRALLLVNTLESYRRSMQ
jgi:methylenetetrahydrofolate dehydrogenase (NADP+)/methenyltetrahydrofolate cyclohydrolase